MLQINHAITECASIIVCSNRSFCPTWYRPSNHCSSFKLFISCASACRCSRMSFLLRVIPLCIYMHAQHGRSILFIACPSSTLGEVMNLIVNTFHVINTYQPKKTSFRVSQEIKELRRIISTIFRVRSCIVTIIKCAPHQLCTAKCARFYVSYFRCDYDIIDHKGNTSSETTFFQNCSQLLNTSSPYAMRILDLHQSFIGINHLLISHFFSFFRETSMYLHETNVVGHNVQVRTTNVTKLHKVGSGMVSGSLLLFRRTNSNTFWLFDRPSKVYTRSSKSSQLSMFGDHISRNYEKRNAEICYLKQFSTNNYFLAWQCFTLQTFLSIGRHSTLQAQISYA